MAKGEIPREKNKYKRPLLYPPEGSKRVAYSRPSTLAKDLDNAKNLIPWSMAEAAIGFAKSPALFARVQAIVAKKGSWKTDKDALKEIVEKAKVAGGSEEKADIGSAIHDFGVPIEEGDMDWSLVPDFLEPQLRGYDKYIATPLREAGIKVIAREALLVVNKPMRLPDGRNITLRVCGSTDRILLFPDGTKKIADVKTGKDDAFRMGVGAQLALYQAGQLYQDKIYRAEIDWADWWPNADGTAEFADVDADPDEGWMLHCPQEPDDSGEWHWRILRVPLEHGRQVVRCGQWARKLRYVREFGEAKL